ncbi:hypothetical protein L207DRAFT_506127 [Hyaloscypha variabilis F]|uniref:Uncharacterized protein n=1 Tax=Hyaloscypha variabilis (strain UAMH 11265 / GT02V1 / F) TaxID=1149755 RepID=A0A2J6S8J0_HYAVF|nr:hypothetical protein L207DRAFT_506127 [Hyaloscypha variabilis F]
MDSGAEPCKADQHPQSRCAYGGANLEWTSNRDMRTNFMTRFILLHLIIFDVASVAIRVFRLAQCAHPTSNNINSS